MKIRHLAFASNHPGQAAAFWKDQLGFTELGRFNIPEDPAAECPRPSGVFLSDGAMNIAILKFGEDQLGRGIDYVGLHHFGVAVDDKDAWTTKLVAAGATPVPYEVPANSHAEYKFMGPDGILFDIAEGLWPGASDK